MAEQNLPGAYENPYKFNAKELDSETGLYYYGARYYNPRISVWYGVDPVAEKHPDYSPYVYCANNPVVLKDPDGRDWIYHYETKSYEWRDDIKSPYDVPLGYGYRGETFFDSLNKYTYAADGYIYDDSANGLGVVIENGRVHKIQEVVITKNISKERLNNGIKNTFFGIVGTLASGAYIVSSDGLGAGLGGATAFTLSIGEVSLGLGQIADSFAEVKKQNEILHNSSSIPGIIAYQNGSAYAPYIDGLGGFIPGMLTGSNTSSLIDVLKKGNYNTISKGINTVANGTDAALDFNGLYQGATETKNNLLQNPNKCIKE